MDWSRIPDLAAIALLTSAFASVASRGHRPVSKLWLSGWLLIAVHFAAQLFDRQTGLTGDIASSISLISLADAAVLFMYSVVPYRRLPASRWMLGSLLATNTLYGAIISLENPPAFALVFSAALFCIVPLVVAYATAKRPHHPLRRMIVLLNASIGTYLLLIQNGPRGLDLAVIGWLFMLYFGCAFHVWWTYHRDTAGAYITVFGFVSWAAVFVTAPCLGAFFPGIHVEGEVWNLPKYVVAVGMILLLLEDELEHNRYLALHDELTGLPNRRLFLDRLSLALERARRNSTRVALLLVDLDRFKQVNDTLGHHVGDLLLRKVAELFSGRIRSCDTVARTGGDEFSLILEDTSTTCSAHVVARELLAQLCDPMQIDGRTILVGASIGVAIFPDDATDVEELRVAADLRMYDEKNCNRVGTPALAPRIPPRAQPATEHGAVAGSHSA